MKSILFFGDSIMAGRGLAKSKTYVSLLTQNIQSASPDRTICYDLAIPEETTANLLKRLEAECRSRIKQKKHESIIIISGGINDIKSADDNRSDFKKISNGLRKNIEKLITQSLAYSAKIIFIGLAPLDENLAVLNSFHVSNHTIQLFNQEIRSICNKRGVDFIDVFALLTNKKTRSHLNDGIHLNEFAHRLISKVLIKKIS